MQNGTRGTGNQTRFIDFYKFLATDNMLNFVGIGSAFNTGLGNTSAFIRNDKSLLLIDSGGTVFHRLQELKLLEGIKNLSIIITHTHPDHIGSLGEVIFYSYYILHLRPNVFFPEKNLIKGLLESIGVSSEMYNIYSTNTAEVKDKHIGRINIEFLPVSHVDTIPSYGCFLDLNNEVIYYSGDANDIDSIVLDKLKDGTIHRIYQDTCGLDYEGNNHLSLRKLCELVPKEHRNKVYCMHLDKHITEKDIKEYGFNIAVLYK